ncbi:MAG: ATP-binding protein [Rivularia sp. (in: cyanobacteria)]
MNYDELVSKIEEICHKTSFLQNRVAEVPKQQDDLLKETFEQLNDSLEELHVAQEELFQQNQELEEYHEQLKLERQRYQELFDFAPDGYLVTDNYGKILEANQAASELLAIDKKKHFGKLLICFVSLEARREFRNQLQRLNEQKQVKNWEILLQNCHKILFDCEITASAIGDKKGNCIGIRWMLRDISARKQAEEKMHFMEMQNYKLQQAEKVKSEIITVLSHELRTPLNVVLGFSDLILFKLDEDELTFDFTIKYVETIKESGSQLLTLINSMLDLAKLQEGKFSLELQPFYMGELIDIIVEKLRFFASQKSISLDFNYNIQDIKVINDPIRFQQILINLINNAIKFTETGGVLVELQEINADQIVITVKDTGIGIPEIDFKYIFQAFRQVDNTMSRNYEGTGLGLAIVKDLVDLMGGTISIESVLSEGSTFRLELPKNVE